MWVRDQYYYSLGLLDKLLPIYFACVDDDDEYPEPQVHYMDVGRAFDSLAPWHQAALYWGYGRPELPADGVVVGQDVRGALRRLQGKLGGQEPRRNY